LNVYREFLKAVMMDAHCYGFCYFSSCGIGMNLGTLAPIGIMEQRNNGPGEIWIALKETSQKV
jgi:hypothetical protein